MKIKSDNTLQAELDRRATKGMRPLSVHQLRARLATLGYRLDRSLDCRSVNRYMDGEWAGLRYPAVNVYIVKADTSMSFAHVNARRDDNFKALQALRLSGELFAVSRGAILEI